MIGLAFDSSSQNANRQGQKFAKCELSLRTDDDSAYVRRRTAFENTEGLGAVVAQRGWEQPGKGGQKPSFDFVKMSFFLGDILD